MKVISTEKVPIKMWLEDIEEGAIKQLKNLANLPFVFKHVAVMPDSHQGYGMPIGGVLATKGVIIPNAVGVDIGCGMSAVKTCLNVNKISTDSIKNVMGAIRQVVPVGKNHNKEACDPSDMPRCSFAGADWSVVYEQWSSAMKQLGTLGGGNHFIEIQKEANGDIWIMLHSGSRNLGKRVADHYNALAVNLNAEFFSSVPKEWELAFLPFGSEVCDRYEQEMAYCVEFAHYNRLKMMQKIVGCFQKEFGLEGGEILGQYGFDAPRDNGIINIAHNYARLENHFGENVMVHRKGATSARAGEIGIIPGSQGTKSYIVRGKGDKNSFESCSHGAGRKMGRKEAERTLNLLDEQKKLDDQGVIHSIRHASDLDEATGAYKDISVVMDNQKDLVDILVELSPVGVIKG